MESASPSVLSQAARRLGEPGPAASGPVTAPVQADRLSDALTRLREPCRRPSRCRRTRRRRSPIGRADRRPAGRWSRPSGGWSSATRRRPASCCSTCVTLQRAVYPHPIAYDLVLGPGRGCVRVTVGEGAPSIERHGAARTRDEVDFRVQGEPARIARLLIAHGIWRRLATAGRPRARAARGPGGARRAAHAAPRPRGAARRRRGAAVRVRPGAGGRHGRSRLDRRRAVRHRPSRSRRAIARPISRPATARASRWAGSRPPAGWRPRSPAPADALVAALTGEAAEAALIAGDEGPLDSLRAWVKRAQSG